MADIIKTCSSCGRQMAVSEYADLSSLKCPACGGSLADPAPQKDAAEARQPAAQPQQGLRFKKREESVVAISTVDNPDVLQKAADSLVRDRVSVILGPDRWRTLRPLVPWVALVALMFILGLVIRLRMDAFVKWMFDTGV